MGSLDKHQVRSVIETRIAELDLLLRPGAQAQIDDDDAAKLDQLINSAVDSATAKAAVADLKRLKDNLNWLQSDDGGFCSDCGREISNARMVALPTTRSCVACAEEKERK